MRRRVAVTGLGVRTPGGCTMDALWDSIVAARPSARLVTRFETHDLRVRFACEVREFDADAFFDEREQRRLDRLTQMGVAAGLDAVGVAGLVVREPSRAGVLFGTGTGGLKSLFEQGKVLFEKGPDRVSPLVVPMMMPNATPAMLAMRLGWTGPNYSLGAACASGACAIGEAMNLIRNGLADVMLAGGGEATIERFALAAFGRTGSMSQRNDAPEHASRPFDMDRDGYVMAEGTALVLLEDYELARERDAVILAEAVGYGQNSDAYHITAPSPGGTGAYACMELALADAGLGVSELGHVNAHGTSTVLNDASEGAALAQLFQNGGTSVPVTSSKGVLGHMMGGAGAAEAVIAVLAMQRAIVPPTANLESLDPSIEIDAVAGAPRMIASDPVMTNSFGFGGHNAVLVFAPAPAA